MKADRRTNPLQATLTAAALTAALVGTGHDARAEDAPPAEAKTWSWDGIYKADLLHIRDARGGVGLLNLRANADAGALFGWDDTTPAANCCGPTAQQTEPPHRYHAGHQQPGSRRGLGARLCHLDRA